MKRTAFSLQGFLLAAHDIVESNMLLKLDMRIISHSKRPLHLVCGILSLRYRWSFFAVHAVSVAFSNIFWKLWCENL